jgi:hypothetical protein
MKQALPIVLALALAACSAQGSDQNPRDRKGADGVLTWRAVTQADGQAAFLSRPGAAPDVVLWCRDGARVVIRAHVFADPSPQPDLRLTTKGGLLNFENVRRQGGIRDGDRQLVEGGISLTDLKVQAVLIAADAFVLQSGADTYDVKNADPTGVLAGFIATCSQAKALSQKSNK